ncbi:unnamed protein product [Thlaspi arvense]|uniref:Aminotransferase-like plant mobile domain-containing protein n=1 Tax=Thlaspi arvense TaxID=13288 RepID=A0AAU9R9I6_THLAR|nr:unnamed protein product [Thlaspi arvense]
MQNRSESCPPDLKALSLSVSFSGWRLANTKFKSWATKMADLHEPTWKKAGIFEAVMASRQRIFRTNTDLVMGIAEKWSPDTKTFVFPWGEATITLEDVMVLLGFSVLGSPYFAPLDSSGEMTEAKLKRAFQKLLEGKMTIVTQVAWMERFMNSEDELEHVAFLVLWLSYFVFPSSSYVISKAVFPIAVHLSRGTRIALAPAVLAHLYAELTLLKNHIRDLTINKSTEKIVLSSLFHLVHVWTWERFRELQPKPNPMVEEGEPRMARWDNLQQRRKSNVRKVLENSKVDSFEWRPYTKTVANWKFPRFYPEKAMSVRWWRKSSLELQCSRVAESLRQRNITGGDGTTSSVPSGPKKRKYTKRARDKDESTLGEFSSNDEKDDDSLTIAQVMGLRKKKCSDVKNNGRDAFGQLGEKSILEDSGPLQKLSWIRADGNEIVPPPEIEQSDEETDEAGSKAGKNTLLSPLDEDNSLVPPKLQPLTLFLQPLGEGFPGILKRSRKRRTTENLKSASREVLLGELFHKDLVKRKSEHLGNKRAREDDDKNCMDDDEEEEEEEEEAGSKAGKNTVLITGNENNSLDPLLGANRGAVESIVSPPETKQNFDVEVDLSGVNAEKKRIMVGDGTKETECLVHEDGEKQISIEKQRMVALYELAANLEARMMKVEKISAKIRKWKTRRNQNKNGINHRDMAKKHKYGRLVLVSCIALLATGLVADFLWATSHRFSSAAVSYWSAGISLPSSVTTATVSEQEKDTKKNKKKKESVKERKLSATFQDLPAPELEWEKMAASPVPRLDGAAIQIRDLLYVFAGYGTIDLVHSHVDIYNFTDNSWGGRFDMPKEMAHSHLGMVTDERFIYIVTGQFGPQCRGPTAKTFVLDTDTNTWEDFVPLPVPRYAPATQLWRGRLHVMGGSKENRFTPGLEHWSIAVKDGKPLENQWRSEIPIPRGGPHRACVVVDDRLFVIGGQEGDFMAKPGSPIFKCSRRMEVVFSDVYMLDEEMKWKVMPPMPKPDSHIEFAWKVVNNSIVIVGGTTEKHPETKKMVLVGEIFQFNLNTLKWYVIGKLPYRVKTTLVGYWDGHIYFTSGQRDKGPDDPAPRKVLAEMWRTKLILNS